MEMIDDTYTHVTMNSIVSPLLSWSQAGPTFMTFDIITEKMFKEKQYQSVDIIPILL